MRLISEEEQRKLVAHAVATELMKSGLVAVEMDPNMFFKLFNEGRDPFRYVQGLYSTQKRSGSVTHAKICGLVGVVTDRLAVARTREVGVMRHEILHDVYVQLGEALKQTIENALEKDHVIVEGKFRNSYEVLGMRAMAGFSTMPPNFATEFVSSYFGCFSVPKERKGDYNSILREFMWPPHFKDALREIGFKVDTYVPVLSR